MTKVVMVPVDFSLNSHKQQLVLLLNAYATLPIGQGRPLGDVQRDRLWESLGQRRAWVHAFLGYVRDEAVALAIAMEGFSTFQCEPLLNIHDFYVAEAWQRKGIGATFLGSLLAHATSEGFAKVTLEVLSGNARAKALYGRLGFAPYDNPVGGFAEFWQCHLK